MQKIMCEMCGSGDLIKQDGAFVCQSCGMKYAPEEIKRMMVEGTVDVQGTVKVDNSAFVEKYLQNARRAKEKEDWAEVEKYYNLVEQNDPTNIEAIFYSSYGKAKSSLVDGDLYKRQAAFNVLQNCISILDDNYDVAEHDENVKIVEKISTDIVVIALSNYVYNQRKNGYGVVTWTDKAETVTLFNNLHAEFCTTLNNIVDKYEKGDARTETFFENMLIHYQFLVENIAKTYKQSWITRIKEMHIKWKAYNESHEIPYIEDAPASSGGCYVATAVYGSYDCPQVWTLRRFRDNTLAETWYGRAFIRTYYAISPTLVKWFGETQWFKNIWKARLDRMVEKLQSKGVDNTPYEDREW